MAQSIVTRAFEAWNVKKTLDGQPAVPDQIVFALIPNQDEDQAVSRDEGMPDAAAIKHRAAITQSGVLNTNAVVYSVVLDTAIGDWDYNWIGLVDSQTQTVLMIVHVRTQQKIKTQNGRQGNSLTRNLAMQFDGAAEATQINVSAQTWQIDFSARLYGMDDALRVALLDYYGPAAFLGDGFNVSVAGTQAMVAPGVGYVGGLRAVLDAAEQLAVSANTGVWVDVSRQGTVTGAWENRVTLRTAAELADYTDENGYAHYIAKVATITAGQGVDNRMASPVYLLDKRFLQIDAAAEKYAPLKSPKLIGAPTAPTASQLTSNSQIATTEFVKAAILALVNDSPADLDTLKSLAEAVNNDPDFSKKVLSALTGKLEKDKNGSDINDVGVFLSNIGAVSLNTFQVITGKKLLSADDDVLTIKPTANGQRAYIQFNNAQSTEAIAFVGMRYGNNEQALTFEHRSGSSIRLVDGEVSLHGLPRVTTAAQGTNTTQIASTEFVQSAINDGAGIPLPWPQAVAPTGWMKCAGQSFNKSEYPKLSLAYPSGVLPDLRGEFIRGWDDARGIDAARVLLSAQGDAIRNITGEIWTTAQNLQFLGENLQSSGVFELLHEFGVGAIADGAGDSCPSRMRFDASRTVPTASENRPRNIAFNYIVRAA
ncbi:phage tail-collar fiber domain-containing protein [Pectobacterium atrosepticum]|uniref:phage tail-collar fiber domain-containing protein n=1 Tax=Pectobacterium atrosepticum TaxID=29471 RepID=UPI000D61E015|nr:phage tail protein [Pectobacterium atrosepticum]PWD62308.1 hypothetical protein DF214_08685 [Pectobacterium atrosepticum]